MQMTESNEFNLNVKFKQIKSNKLSFLIFFSFFSHATSGETMQNKASVMFCLEKKYK